MQSRDQYYIRYLSDVPEPRTPPTDAMSVGSAFDAYVKCAIWADLQVQAPCTLEELLKKQVDPMWLDTEYGWQAGNYIMQEYKASGAYALLLEDLNASEIEPMFEFEIKSSIAGVPVKGFPDCFYRRNSLHQVLDFKVNGYVSGAGKPKTHYVRRHRDGAKHKLAILGGPIVHNIAAGLEKVDKSWAIQQAMYALALGAEPGYMCTLEQIVGLPVGLDFYTYRAGIGADFEKWLIDTLKQMWHEIQTNTVVTAERAAELDGPFRHLELHGK